MIRPEVAETAAKFNGRKYPLRLSSAEKQQLKESRLVVVHPHSDDCAEIEGAITDEAGVWEGGDFLLGVESIITHSFKGLERYTEETTGCFMETMEARAFLDSLEAYCKAARSAIKIEAIWAEGGYSWQYKLDIPHSTFDLMENDKTMAKCVVFHVDDMGAIN